VGLWCLCAFVIFVCLLLSLGVWYLWACGVLAFVVFVCLLLSLGVYYLWVCGVFACVILVCLFIFAFGIFGRLVSLLVLSLCVCYACFVIFGRVEIYLLELSLGLGSLCTLVSHAA